MAQFYAKARYTDDNGETHPIRLGNFVIAAQPTAPVLGPPWDSNISADVGRSAREIGLRPRVVLLQRTAGAAPNVKTFNNRMPVCLAADVATLEAAGTVTIDGTVWNVVGSQGESKR